MAGPRAPLRVSIADRWRTLRLAAESNPHKVSLDSLPRYRAALPSRLEAYHGPAYRPAPAALQRSEPHRRRRNCDALRPVRPPPAAVPPISSHTGSRNTARVLSYEPSTRTAWGR